MHILIVEYRCEVVKVKVYGLDALENAEGWNI